MSYNRYNILNKNTHFPPFVDLKKSQTDKYVEWKDGDRYDKYSNYYYQDPSYSFLIGYANPKYLCEWDIPIGEIIRIPFPLDRVLDEYEQTVM